MCFCFPTKKRKEKKNTHKTKTNKKHQHSKYKTENTVGIPTKSNRTIIEKSKSDTSNTQMHDRSFFWFGTGTSMKSGGVMTCLIQNVFPLFKFLMFHRR